MGSDDGGWGWSTLLVVLTQIDPLKGFGQFHDYTLHERTENMNDLELLERLKAHETFGISMVQDRVVWLSTGGGDA
ncbi:hypothetical protein [Pseudomonas huaxiensis]|uniref:hypothetical protein n=1 Tax=Pseudomonas huaxiensis TaxID=2213017 RepID=UPI000DA6A964|nr:hypothetical protein [Pseudomonas huaxiensis]